AFHALMYTGLSSRNISPAAVGSSGSQGNASKSSSDWPALSRAGGCEWLSIALIWLISSSSPGSGMSCELLCPNNERETKIMAAERSVVFIGTPASALSHQPPGHRKHHPASEPKHPAGESKDFTPSWIAMPPSQLGKPRSSRRYRKSCSSFDRAGR